jgi:hypothetical protein
MRKVWAVARNTLAGALRMKIAAIVIVLLGALLPLMSLVMVGDGTLLGKLQTFSSYSLSLIGVMLCVLTIAVSAFTLSDEIRRKQIFMTVTKPISRWQLLLGKFLGVIILDVILLIAFAALVYGLTCMIPYLADATPRERLVAQNEFFTAREGLKIQEDTDQLNKRVEERYLQLEKEGRLPESMTQQDILVQLVNEERTREQSINPGQSHQWDFHGLRPSSDPNTMIFVRFKYDGSATSADGKIYGLWSVGDLTSYVQGSLTTPIFNVSWIAPARVVQEFAVPAGTVTQQGDLSIGFLNNPELNSTTVMIRDLEVLYKVGSFTDNYCRALLLLLIRLVFLAALGITLTTWLSFPVAMLGCVAVFALGSMNGFIVDSLSGLEIGIGLIYKFTIHPLLFLLPRFDGVLSPTQYIITGKSIGWLFLLKAAGETVGLKTVLLLFLGMFVFRSREVAKTSV